MSKQFQTTAKNLEARHQAGEDVLDYFDAAGSVRINHRKSRVNLDLPDWMIQRLDVMASRNGIARQAQIKAFLAEMLKKEAA